MLEQLDRDGCEDIKKPTDITRHSIAPVFARSLCSHHSRSEVKTMNARDSCRILHIHTEDRSQMLAGGSRIFHHGGRISDQEVSASEY